MNIERPLEDQSLLPGILYLQHLTLIMLALKEVMMKMMMTLIQKLTRLHHTMTKVMNLVMHLIIVGIFNTRLSYSLMFSYTFLLASVVLKKEIQVAVVMRRNHHTLTVM